MMSIFEDRILVLIVAVNGHCLLLTLIFCMYSVLDDEHKKQVNVYFTHFLRRETSSIVAHSIRSSCRLLCTKSTASHRLFMNNSKTWASVAAYHISRWMQASRR